MLPSLRHTIIKHLWTTHRATSREIKQIEAGLKQKHTAPLVLDHFAIIDLPGPKTGIPQLSQIFSLLGYEVRGQDYLADKQNDFLWLAESGSDEQYARDVLPQVVVADFRIDELPIEIRKIITHYADYAPTFPLSTLKQQIADLQAGKSEAATHALSLLAQYFSGRDWPLPTCKEFSLVREFNELLAWVLVFGRRPNHFTLSIHHLNAFVDLTDFHRFIEDELQLTLNREGGLIKGGKSAGIAQSSTLGITQNILLADGEIAIPTQFVEFVWRYPLKADSQPLLWKDFFTGFIASHADHVIESLYVAYD